MRQRKKRSEEKKLATANTVFAPFSFCCRRQRQRRRSQCLRIIYNMKHMVPIFHLICASGFCDAAERDRDMKKKKRIKRKCLKTEGLKEESFFYSGLFVVVILWAV